MTLKEAKARLSVDALWLRLELPGEPGGSCRSPFREDEHPSFSVFADGQRFHDHAEGTGGDAIDFLQRATGLSKSSACRKFIEMANGLPLDPLLVEAIEDIQHAIPGCRSGRAERPLSRVELPKLTEQLDSLCGREFVRDLARLRSVTPESVRLAHDRGLVRFAQYMAPGYKDLIEWIPVCRCPVWIITDQTRYNAQLRWLDGSKWESLPGAPKTKTWPGSCASWPIGVNEALPYPLVVLVEGGPDLLAAHHFALQACVENDLAVVAMMGAGQTIHREALPLFAGKRVRIFPHFDDPGREAAKRWRGQLCAVDAEVDAFNLEGLRHANGAPVTDLNDCCLIHPDDAAELEALFII